MCGCQCTFLLLTHLMPKNLWSVCSLQRRWGRRCVYCYYEMRAVPDGRRLQYCGRTLVTGQLGWRCANIENRSFSLVATLALAGCVISSSSTGKLGGAFISQEHEGAPIYWSPYYSWFFLGGLSELPFTPSFISRILKTKFTGSLMFLTAYQRSRFRLRVRLDLELFRPQARLERRTAFQQSDILD